MIAKLHEGIAELLYKGEWVEAITDEVARETARFQRWDGNTRIKYVVRFREENQLTRGRFAIFTDCNGRMWRQREYVTENGIKNRMIVKVIVHPTHVLIHSEDHSVHMEHPLSSVLIARLGGVAIAQVGHAAFFHAVLTSGVVELDEKAAPQTW